jgi:hypothetical protein
MRAHLQLATNVPYEARFAVLCGPVGCGDKVVAERERCMEGFVGRVCDRDRDREVRRATEFDRRRFKT